MSKSSNNSYGKGTEQENIEIYQSLCNDVTRYILVKLYREQRKTEEHRPLFYHWILKESYFKVYD